MLCISHVGVVFANLVFYVRMFIDTLNP